MEAVFHLRSLGHAVGAGRLAGVEVRINFLQLVEDERRLVAVNVAVLVLGFESVALDYEQGVVVPRGDLRGLPCQAVVVDVPVPLCDY